MNKFVRNLITEWRKLDLPFADEKIVIAVSGGADSVALALALRDLHEMKKFKVEFVVAHFDHGLRGAASRADAEFVESFARELNFRFICAAPHAKLQKQAGNLEQNARRARYEFLTKTAIGENASFILTAHTLNDQAETFLLNLLRGSGIDGLSAMKARRNAECGVRSAEFKESLESAEFERNLESNEKESKEKSAFCTPHSPIEIVRPLLSWAKREATEEFCRENAAEFRRDAMNEDLKFARVRVRRELIPLLKTYNPKIVKTLAQTADLLREERKTAARENFETTECLAVSELKDLPENVRMQRLRMWLKNRRGDLRRIEAKHLQAIENLIFSRKSGRIAELPKGGKVVKSRGKLCFEANIVEKR